MLDILQTTGSIVTSNSLLYMNLFSPSLLYDLISINCAPLFLLKIVIFTPHF
ncbi:hypothetical protein Scep_022375 [Stephania cephalantha]|uniref:Uncharacterized protein n=1 Tax=Stephania cephalantha TaxID=152367 RepID=A0AAP0F5A2_9MAGN